MADLDTWVSAISAAVSAVAAVVTARLTYTIKTINRGQLDHDQHVDRAYMSCGGVRDTQLSPDRIRQVPGDKFVVHFNNHGSTPGECMRIAIGFCDAKNIPAEPDYKPEAFHDWIGPGTQSRPMMWKRIEPKNATAVYGRIYYKDIYGKEHSSGFFQDLPPEGGSTALAGPAAYTAWD